MIDKLGITPGPWTFSKCQCGHHCCNKYNINHSGANGMFEIEDSRLIAAAPDMLEALIEGVVRNERNGEPCEQMYMAVEKATGKTWNEIKTIFEEDK